MLHRSIFYVFVMLAMTVLASAPSTAVDYESLAKQFSSRAEQGDPIAQNNLGALYLQGKGVQQNYITAKNWFEQAASQELPGAMFNLAMVYLRGYGVEADLNKTNHLLEKSAQRGDRDAQFFLGLHYSKGIGFDENLDAAKIWFRRAAEQGVAAAMYNLGVIYLDPDPAKGDETQALTWLEKASAKDYPGAELVIARVHLSHVEDPLRMEKGAQQYMSLAESNNLDAQIQLGMMYTFGQGVEQNYDEGRFWLERAASQGASQAQLNLGNIFAEGLGVDKDLGLALAWYSIAAANGDQAAAKNATLLSDELDDAQKQAAEQKMLDLRERFGPDLNTVTH